MDSKAQRPLKRSIFSLEPEEKKRVKTRKGQKIIAALIDLLVIASQEIERTQYTSDPICLAQFNRIKKNKGSVENAKLFILMDRFEEVLSPWLEKNRISTTTINNFKTVVGALYLDVLNRAKTNPGHDINHDFAHGLEKILSFDLDTHFDNDASDALKTGLSY